MPGEAEGAPNPNIPKPFSALAPEQKARAILAVANEPISRELLYDFAGIKVNELKDPEKKTLEGLFTDPLIQKRDNEKFGAQQYWVEEDQKKRVLKELGVDELDATRQLAYKLLNNLFGDE